MRESTSPYEYIEIKSERKPLSIKYKERAREREIVIKGRRSTEMEDIQLLTPQISSFTLGDDVDGLWMTAFLVDGVSAVDLFISMYSCI